MQIQSVSEDPLLLHSTHRAEQDMKERREREESSLGGGGKRWRRALCSLLSLSLLCVPFANTHETREAEIPQGKFLKPKRR